MKQENRFVAELFHYFAPFIDREHEVFLCVDGGAAKHHSGKEGAALRDPDVPDLWFRLVGSSQHIGIEAKVLDDQNCMSFRGSQIRAWRPTGTGLYRPAFWVATDRALQRFHGWRHETLAPRLGTTASTRPDVRLSLTGYDPEYSGDSLAELALFILRNA